MPGYDDNRLHLTYVQKLNSIFSFVRLCSQWELQWILWSVSPQAVGLGRTAGLFLDNLQSWTQQSSSISFRVQSGIQKLRVMYHKQSSYSLALSTATPDLNFNLSTLITVGSSAIGSNKQNLSTMSFLPWFLRDIPDLYQLQESEVSMFPTQYLGVKISKWHTNINEWKHNWQFFLHVAYEYPRADGISW